MDLAIVNKKLKESIRIVGGISESSKTDYAVDVFFRRNKKISKKNLFSDIVSALQKIGVAKIVPYGDTLRNESSMLELTVTHEPNSEDDIRQAIEKKLTTGRVDVYTE